MPDTHLPRTRYKMDRRTALTADEIAAMVVRPLGDDGEVTALLFEGDCPTCGHRTRDVSPVATIADQDPSTKDVDIRERGFSIITAKINLRPRDTRPRRSIVVSCQCAHDHEGSKGALGCGRGWMVTAQFDPRDRQEKVHLSRPTEAELTLWPDVVAFDAAAADPLKVVRDAGDKWQKALAGILAIVGLTAIVGGRDTFAKLDDRWPERIAICVLAVLALTAVATYCAHMAAIGFPTFKAMTQNESLASFALNPLRQARKGVFRIRIAMTLTTSAFILTLFVLGAVWLAPDKTEPPDPDLQAGVTLSTGDSWDCATLTPSKDATKVKLTLPNKAEVEVAWRDVAKLSAANCA